MSPVASCRRQPAARLSRQMARPADRSRLYPQPSPRADDGLHLIGAHPHYDFRTVRSLGANDVGSGRDDNILEAVLLGGRTLRSVLLAQRGNAVANAIVAPLRSECEIGRRLSPVA